MKNNLVIVFILFSLNNLFSQEEVNVGVNTGITIGNIENFSTFAYGLDANYLFEVSNNIKVGPSLNFVLYLPKEFNGERKDSFLYMPIGGSVRFHSASDAFYFGIDAGFAVGLSPSGDSGGIFFKPLLGYKLTDSFKFNLFYSAVKKRQPTYSHLGLGIVYNLWGR